MIYDYIIVGSGPAGSAAAYRLQMRGAKCLILEARKSKEEKTCGGYLTWFGIQFIEEINLAPAMLLDKGTARIDSVSSCRNHRTVIHHSRNGEYGIGTTRILLDQWLLDYALESGSKIIYGCNVRDFSKEDDIFNVCGYKCKTLVMATGARGYIDRCVLNEQSMGISAQIEGQSSLNENCVHFWFFDQSNDYFWAIPIGNKRWNIGVWFQSLKHNSMKCFYNYKTIYIDSCFSFYEYISKPRGAFCGNIDLSKNLPKNCYGIGDFAGHTNPLTGEGISRAIQSAILFSNNQMH
jgi:flavin-dependent dehydrogenase